MSRLTPTYTDMEFEVISLDVALTTINSMANWLVLELYGHDDAKELKFPTETHQKYFYVILLDFISEVNGLFTGADITCMDLLGRITARPQLEIDNSAKSLQAAHSAFKAWLATDVTVDVADLGQLTLSREEIIYIAGNISKHHFGRLTNVIKKLQRFLAVSTPEQNIMLALEQVYFRFNDDILSYHACTIAEHVNNIRWGIHEYLLPEYRRSYREIEDADLNVMRYDFDVPTEITTDLARSCYWDLMNSVRTKPYIPRFVANEVLKERY